MSRDTRERIVRAVRRLHETRGPAETSVTAIAEEAGVQRLTVYRHLPEETDRVRACSAHWRADHPEPDPTGWMGIPEPRNRLRAALEALYRYFEGGGPMLEKVLRDEGRVPELAEVMEPWWDYLRQVAAGLAAGWEVEGEAQRELRAAVGHAVRFYTWRSLAREGLAPTRAAGVMTEMVACLAARRR